MDSDSVGPGSNPGSPTNYRVISSPSSRRDYAASRTAAKVRAMGGTEFLIVYGLMLLAVGLVAGLLAGLLGVGGGIVIVPALYLMFHYLDIAPDILMHLAVGTSLATIIPTSIRSVLKHNSRNAVDKDILRHWGPWLFLGAVIGTIIAAYISTGGLTLVFGFIGMAVALHMAFASPDLTFADKLPKGVVGSVIPLVSGTISTLMGIGGGTLGVPIMTLFKVPIHRAVGTASGFGVIIAVPATIGFIYNGWQAPNLPDFSLGYISLIGFALIVPATLMSVPLGVKLAHWLNPILLRRAFALFLAMTAGRMLWDSLV
jgi:uncharacterized membrane protein YfcA